MAVQSGCIRLRRSFRADLDLALESLIRITELGKIAPQARWVPRVRVVVSVGLLALVATQIDFDAIRSRLAGGSWGLFAVAVIVGDVIFVSFLVGALRWHIFLQAAWRCLDPAAGGRC